MDRKRAPVRTMSRRLHAQVAGQLRSGALSPKDVPINVVIRDEGIMERGEPHWRPDVREAALRAATPQWSDQLRL